MESYEVEVGGKILPGGPQPCTGLPCPLNITSETYRKLEWSLD